MNLIFLLSFFLFYTDVSFSFISSYFSHEFRIWHGRKSSHTAGVRWSLNMHDGMLWFLRMCGMGLFTNSRFTIDVDGLEIIEWISFGELICWAYDLGVCRYTEPYLLFWWVCVGRGGAGVCEWTIDESFFNSKIFLTWKQVLSRSIPYFCHKKMFLLCYHFAIRSLSLTSKCNLSNHDLLPYLFVPIMNTGWFLINESSRKVLTSGHNYGIFAILKGLVYDFQLV